MTLHRQRPQERLTKLCGSLPRGRSLDETRAAFTTHVESVLEGLHLKVLSQVTIRSQNLLLLIILLLFIQVLFIRIVTLILLVSVGGDLHPRPNQGITEMTT